MKQCLLLVCICLLATAGRSAAEELPLGIMSVGTADFPRVAAAGFNIVHNYAFESNEDDDNPTVNNEAHVRSYLDAAQKQGLKAIVGFARHALKRVDLAYVRRRVNLLKEHPALFGWYLYDEPEREAGKFASPADLRKIYEAIKALDGRHPVIMSSYSIVQADNGYLNALDILAADQYPIPEYPPDFVLSRIDPAFRSTRARGKKAWAILQAHNTGIYRKKPARYPTKEEMRSMAYLSLMHGVQGVLFYCYNDGYNNIGSEAARAHWDDLSSVVREIKNIGRVMTGPARAVLAPQPSLVLELWTKEQEGSIYAIAANRSKQVMRSEVRISDLKNRSLLMDVMFEERTVAIKQGVLTDVWLPYQVHVYRANREGEQQAPLLNR